MEAGTARKSCMFPTPLVTQSHGPVYSVRSLCVCAHGVGNGSIVRGTKRAEKVRKEESAYSTY